MRKALHHWIATAARMALGAGLLWMGADMAQAQAFVQSTQLPESVTRMVTRRVAELQPK